MTDPPDCQGCRPDSRAWLVLSPNGVPDAWAERAVPSFVVALLPNELESVLGGTAAVPDLDPTDLRVARLTAGGATTRQIATALGVSDRTVQRRLASLRRRLGVESKAALALALARRGF